MKVYRKLLTFEMKSVYAEVKILLQLIKKWKKCSSLSINIVRYNSGGRQKKHETKVSSHNLDKIIKQKWLVII